MSTPQRQRGSQGAIPPGYGAPHGGSGGQALRPSLSQQRGELVAAGLGIGVGAVDSVLLLTLNILPDLAAYGHMSTTTAFGSFVFSLVLNVVNLLGALAAFVGGVRVFRGKAAGVAVMGAGAALAGLMHFYYLGELLGDGYLGTALFGAPDWTVWASLIVGLLAILVVVLVFRPRVYETTRVGQPPAAGIASSEAPQRGEPSQGARAVSPAPTEFSQQTSKLPQPQQARELSPQASGFSQQTSKLPQQARELSPQASGFSQQTSKLPQQARGSSQPSGGFTEQPTAVIRKPSVPAQQPGPIPQQSNGFPQQAPRQTPPSSDGIQWPR